MKKSLFILCLGTLFLSATYASAQEATPKERVLVFTRNGKGYVHKNIPACVGALQQLAKEHGFIADISDDPSIFTDKDLSRYQAVVFANTNNDTVGTEENKAAFQRYIRNGGGFVGIHSATGSERNWPWYWELIGGSFSFHAPSQTFTLRVVDRDHPSTSFYGADPWSWDDEFYFVKHVPDGRRVLLAGELGSLRANKRVKEMMATEPDPYPLSWCREFEGGRSWYTALGHQPEHYADPLFRRHLLGGILWAMGRETTQVANNEVRKGEHP